MSRPKYDWWVNVVWMVRNYPARKKEYEELHRQTVSLYSGMPSGHDVSRTTENIALRQMPPMKQREFEAVSRAIEITKLLPDGELRIELIRRIYWQGKKLNIEDVVYGIGIAEATGYRWHKRFILQVGECAGYET